MARHVTRVAIVVVLVAGGTFTALVPAQQPVTLQTELLAEVRLLRQAIESLAGTNARVQIVFGRLTLQEQRVANAAKRLDEARVGLLNVTRELENLAQQADDLDQVVSDGRREPTKLEQARVESVIVKRQQERMESERVRRVGDEAEAASALNQEQGRWSDLNRQLEELERALVKR